MICNCGRATKIDLTSMLLIIVASGVDCVGCNGLLLDDDELLACRCRKCVDRDGCVEE